MERFLFTYAKVEAVLARVFEVTPEQVGALRGRLKNYQRLGLSPKNPGSGKRVSYESSDVYNWAFCLALAEFGTDPRLIARMVKPKDFKLFELIESHFAGADNQNAWGGDFYIMLEPQLFYDEAIRPLYTTWTDNDFGTGMPKDKSFGFINISELKRRIDAVLDLQTCRVPCCLETPDET